MKSCEDRLSLLDFSDEYSFNNKKNRQYNKWVFPKIRSQTRVVRSVKSGQFPFICSKRRLEETGWRTPEA